MSDPEVASSPVWGNHLIFPCRHQALILGEHDIWHPHFCPLCRPGETTCGVEYLDVH